MSAEPEALLEQDSEGDEGEDSSPPRGSENKPTLEESLLIARLLFWTGRVSEADRSLRKLVREHQTRTDLLKLWAQIKHTQGQLTDAIRAVERMHALLPPEHNALLNLEMIHRMSQNPETAKRELELELVGDDKLARAHRAQLELERAFRLAASQKFTSAVAICDGLAERYKSTDANLFKLALLEKAIFLEGIGQFDGAIQTLERLGSTRGFEVDRDRLLSLARIYERRGTAEDLARVQKVYSFLFEQTGAAEYLSRMARVADRRGDRAEADRLDRAFIATFRKEQQELTLEELLDAAALHYVPLPSLRTLAPPAEELEEMRKKLESPLRSVRLDEGATSPSADRDRGRERRLAILLALAGDAEGSAELWRSLMQSGASLPVDAKYFADLREEAGDQSGARALYLAALSEERSADVSVLGKLFEPETPDPSVIGVLGLIFEEPEKRARALESLKQSAKGHQLSPEVWRTLALFEGLIGHDEDAARHHAKADALLRVQRRAKPWIGQVQVAAVYEFQGRKRGMVHEIWASRYRVGSGAGSGEGGQLDEGSIFGNIARDMMRDIQNVFVAVRTFVERKFPHLVEDLGQYRYVLKVTKDDEPSGGSSAGIAVALAFVSVFLQKPVPQDFAITGSLVADSSSEIRLHRVADVEYKMLGVYQRRLSRLIVPMENRIDLEATHIIPRSIWESRVSFARNLTQVMKLVFGADLWEW